MPRGQAPAKAPIRAAQESKAADLQPEKLGIEIELLRRQLARGGRPPWWEVLKTLVPWISVAVGALAFTTGYLHSLRQEEQTLLKGATDYYLGDHPDVGAVLLADLAKPPWLLRRFSSRSADPVQILIGGIDVKPRGKAEADELNRLRNLAALSVLQKMSATPIPSLCPKYRAAREVLKAQFQNLKDANLSELKHTVEFLCACTQRSLLDEKCQRESWQDYDPDTHGPILLEWADCIEGAARHAP